MFVPATTSITFLLLLDMQLKKNQILQNKKRRQQNNSDYIFYIHIFSLPAK